MKTRKEWFDLLPTDVRKKAIKNLKNDQPNDYKDWLNSEVSTMSFSIKGAFIFDGSPEGLKYWVEISEDPKWKQYEEETK